MKEAVYGTWTSPVTAATVAAASQRVAEPAFDAQCLYWIESRPQDNGRCVVVRQTASGLIEDILPRPWSARSKVHEYGGGVYVVWSGTLYFVNASDQQIYAMDLETRQPVPLTAAPSCRFADLTMDPHRKRLLAVCEDHRDPGHPANRLVAVDLDSRALQCVASGHDFYASPTVSACGRWLAYITWDHPDMPWDATRLWLAALNTATAAVCIAGEQAPESLFQPHWSAEGALYWVSDRSGWWNLYTLDAEQIHRAAAGATTPAQSVAPMAAEFATPQWTFRMATYGSLDAHTLFACWSQGGEWRMGYLRRDMNLGVWHCTPVASDLCAISNVCVRDGRIALVGASKTTQACLWRVDASGVVPVRPTSGASGPGTEYLSQARVLPFPIAGAANAEGHAFYYPPRNPAFKGPADARPPVIVIGHGGPTGAADNSLNYKVQFWTSRGFAVLDVNYRGSTGFGRDYRRALYGQWGIADVEDLIAAATRAVELGWADPDQCIIRGSSAGGFSVLCALTDSTRFSAGVSLYGIGDLEALVADTHKFEARYVDALVGPWPAMKAEYVRRSPLHKADQIQCPLLVFQGMEDKVVPPNQAEAMVVAVRARGLPVAFVTYADEAHGFRQAANIAHQLNAELEFYRQIFGWPTSANPETPAAPLLEIHNLNGAPMSGSESRR